MIMARNLEVPEIHKFEAMLKWAKNMIKKQGYQNKSDAKADFRVCMDRLSRDLKLYRISPQVGGGSERFHSKLFQLQDLVLTSKTIKNERILETLNVPG